ncbi:MAG: DUF5009 domain-containing protein [Candidatus Latescibacterota bacterium]|jgi:predicted acyltransferase
MSETTVTAPRIDSIDVLRGLTILAMLFVNDLAGVAGVPAWLKHVEPPLSDGMTAVDVVFPAFLFIVGMAIPAAHARWLAAGRTLAQIGYHVVTRAAGLLIIGLLMVNAEHRAPNGPLPGNLWALLMYVAVLAVWQVVPRAGRGRRVALAGRWVGVAVLVGLAFLYRGDGAPGLIELRPRWWGILGLIGWAYLVATTAHLALRGRRTGLLGSMALLYCLYAAYSVDALPWFPEWVNGAMLGSLAAVTVAGAVLGTVLVPGAPVAPADRAVRWGLLYAAGLALAGFLLHALAPVHRIFTYNKILATIPWCLHSSAITAAVWTGVTWVTEVRGCRRWSRGVTRAGQCALFAYLLAPVAGLLLQYLPQALGGHDPYGALGLSFGPGLCRSAGFAVAIAWLAVRLRGLGLGPRL